MTGSIHVDRGVAIELRDGTLLRGDIYRPWDRGKHPAILMRTRYDRLGWVRNFTATIMPLLDTVLAGYAVVVQNVRGTYDSEGVQKLDDPWLTIEGPDSYDTVEWIAGQPWCDGNVGMAGGSALGPVQWAAARENPPHLRAIAPWISGSGMLPGACIKCTHLVSGTTGLLSAAWI